MKDVFRKLSEPLDKSMVEARIGMTSAKGFSLLLYKTARTDINKLNDSGAIWQNKHEYDAMGLLTCTISVFDTDHKLWINRVDVGTESQTEKQKGLYSDSFKRTGFRFGIGLELYNAPFIWVTWDMEQFNNKWKPKGFFGANLNIIDYETVSGHFTKLSIGYEGRIIYKMKEVDTPVSQEQVLQIQALITETQTELPEFLKYFRVNAISDLTSANAVNAITTLNKKKAKQ